MRGTIDIKDNRFCVVLDSKPIKCYPLYDTEHEYMIGDEIDVEIIDEFTHPQYYQGVGWGDGERMAKLK